MAIRKKRFISDFSAGDTIDELFLVRESSVRQARNGSFYLQAVLADKSGDIQVRQWDVKEEDGALYPVSGFVRCQGRVEEYRGKPQLVIQRIKVMQAEQLDRSDFLQASSFDLEELENEFRSFIKLVADPYLNQMLNAIFTPELMERFRVHPAGAKLHHGFVGGLLEHTTMMARSAVALCEANPRLDRDLMIVGCLLHDIGKLDEIGSDLDRNYTDIGRLLGHLTIGVLRVEQAIQGIDGFPERLRLLVHHLILSHHGSHEFGSPVLPCTPEAVALHHLDNIDAKIEAATRTIAACPNDGQDFTDRQFMFGNIHLYKLGRPDADEADAALSNGGGKAKQKSGKSKANDQSAGLFD